MITIPEALAQYIAVRRALGAKLREPAVRLGEFVDFLKNQEAEFITTELALCWAMQRSRSSFLPAVRSSDQALDRGTQCHHIHGSKDSKRPF
jgi:hypothetical protein